MRVCFSVGEITPGKGLDVPGHLVRVDELSQGC